MTKTVHFTVCPRFLTNHVRDLWAEGSFDKSLKTLHSAFPSMPLEMKHDIIRGKRKLVAVTGDPGAMNCVKDKWTPCLNRCSYGKYPDPEDIASLAECANRLLEEDHKNNVSYVMNLLISIKESEDALEIADLHHCVARMPKEAIAEAESIMRKLSAPSPMPMERFGGYGSLEEMNMAFAFKQSIPTVEEVIERNRDRDARAEKGKPKPDRKLTAKMGWVLPDGKFYACLTPMEHIWLASQFGLTESQAEQSGWIKISVDFIGKTFIHKFSDPTQKQINTVFDWCEKHKKPLPDWAGGKE